MTFLHNSVAGMETKSFRTAYREMIHSDFFTVVVTGTRGHKNHGHFIHFPKLPVAPRVFIYNTDDGKIAK